MPRTTPTRQSPNRKGKGTLSATNLAIHHHLQCDLYLHNVYYGPPRSTYEQDNVAIATDASPGVTSTITAAHLSRGNDWEAKLLSWLDSEGLLMRVASGVLDGDDVQSLIELALDERDHFFIAGLTLQPPMDALRSTSQGHALPVQFGVAKPDLIEVKMDKTGKATWQVIDAKASSDVKTSHHVQIYFYHLCLQHMLASPFFTPMGKASIWLPPFRGTSSHFSVPSLNDLKPIPTSLLSVPLDEFFFQSLPELMSTPHEDVKWHYNALCQGCPFENDCSERAVREGKLGAMANISIQDEQVLQDFISLAGVRVANMPRTEELTDIECLDQIVTSDESMERFRVSHPSIVKKAERILKLPQKRSRKGTHSPVIDAARTRVLQIIPKRIYTMPKQEDIAVVISLVVDPYTNSIAQFCISTYSQVDYYVPSKPVVGDSSQLISTLSQTLRLILELASYNASPPRTQCYTFTAIERVALQKYLVDAAITTPVDPLDTSSDQAALRLCIGALCEGADLLATSFQPLVLSGALLGFLAKQGERSEGELRICLERLGVPQIGTADEMRTRLNEEIERLKQEGRRHMNNVGSRPEIGQLSRLVIVKREVERLIALPVPGYWDLPDCFSALTLGRISIPVPSDEQIYSAFTNGEQEHMARLMVLRNDCVHMVIKKLRRRITSGSKSTTSTRGDRAVNKDDKLVVTPDVLVNEARVLSARFMDVCKQEHLRKLFFMQQFEVLTKLSELWQSRIDGCPDAALLQYKFTKKSSDGKYLHTFALVSGSVEAPNDKERSYFEYILCEDTDYITSGGNNHFDSGIPVEALFNDLLVFNLVFPLTNSTRSRWDAQPREVQGRVFVADVDDIMLRGSTTMVTCKTWGAFDLRLGGGKIYRLSKRLVDFNLNKVLSTLLELDLQTPFHPPLHLPNPPVPAFLQLFARPREFATLVAEDDEEGNATTLLKEESMIHHAYRKLVQLDVKGVERLVLMSSQRRALQRVLSHRLTVIWGPPGTGKTYTVALSVLRLLEVQYRCGFSKKQIIFITAMTHAAIDACMSKLAQLRDVYRGIDGMQRSLKWLDDISFEHVLMGTNHPPPNACTTHIYAGTVFQLYNISKRHSLQPSVVIIDEAGQLGLGSASLVLRTLEPNGRVIMAGDSEQLAPILTSQYPKLETPLFGSVLDCVMHRAEGGRNDAELNVDDEIDEIITSTQESDLSMASTVVQLRENFRLNEDLSAFVSTIYRKKLKSQKSQTNKIAKQLLRLQDIKVSDSMLDKANSDAHSFLVSIAKAMLRKPQSLLRPPRNVNFHKSSSNSELGETQTLSLALIQLRTRSTRPELSGVEAFVRGEAVLAAALVQWLRTAAPAESVFVATPHRIQRHAVKEALADFNKGADLAELLEGLSLANGGDWKASNGTPGRVTVDTIERLQGSEASFVICLFSLPTSQQGSLNFLLDRRRLNVALSRSKTLCILVTSPNVLRPNVRVLADPAAARGWAFLRSFEERAWVGDIELNLDKIVPA